LYVLAHRKMTDGNYRDAATLLRLMLHLAPEDERSWFALALCHEQIGQIDVARQLYAAGAVAAKPAGRCALASARMCLELGRMEEATQQYELALAAFAARGDDELHQLTEREMELRHGD
jgi:Tfp pilus assembly protein PilF